MLIQNISNFDIFFFFFFGIFTLEHFIDNLYTSVIDIIDSDDIIYNNIFSVNISNHTCINTHIYLNTIINNVHLYFNTISRNIYIYFILVIKIDNKNDFIDFIIDILIFTTFVIHFYIFNNDINLIVFIFNILIQNLIHIDFFHNFINHLYLVTFIIHKTYFILTFGIILDITYIKMHIYIEYSINNIENSEIISYTIIFDFNNTIDISYNCIIIPECYKTIGEANLIRYVNTEKTSNE